MLPRGFECVFASALASSSLQRIVESVVQNKEKVPVCLPPYYRKCSHLNLFRKKNLAAIWAPACGKFCIVLWDNVCVKNITVWVLFENVKTSFENFENSIYHSAGGL